MKFTSVITAILMAGLLSTHAFAEYNGPVKNEAHKLQDILDNPKDEQLVRLKGYLVEKTGDENYIFSDGKAKIQIEIDQHVFPEEPFNETQLIEITGEVEKDFTQAPEIEVESLSVLK